MESNRKKVMKALKYHLNQCSEVCPYFHIDDYCTDELCKDALEVLKEQEEEIKRLRTQLDEAMLWR